MQKIDLIVEERTTVRTKEGNKSTIEHDQIVVHFDRRDTNVLYFM